MTKLLDLVSYVITFFTERNFSFCILYHFEQMLDKYIITLPQIQVICRLLEKIESTHWSREKITLSQVVTRQKANNEVRKSSIIFMSPWCLILFFTLSRNMILIDLSIIPMKDYILNLKLGSMIILSAKSSRFVTSGPYSLQNHTWKKFSENLLFKSKWVLREILYFEKLHYRLLLEWASFLTFFLRIKFSFEKKL